MTKLFRHGLAIESEIKSVFLSVPGVKQVTLHKQDVLQTLSPIYRDKQLGYLSQEGYVHWGQVPFERLLDQCLGIDLFISYKGFWYGLDITAKWTRVQYKTDRFKERNKRGMLRSLDLDNAAVVYGTTITTERAEEILTTLRNRHHRFGDVIVI